MMPEREKRIREAWANAGPGTVQMLREREILRLNLSPPRPRLATQPPPAEEPTVEIIVVTKKIREMTWSAVCEGLELATYRR